MIQSGRLIIDRDTQWIIDDTRVAVPIGSVIFSLTMLYGFVKANGAVVLKSDYPRLAQYATRNNLWTTDPDTYTGLFGDIGDPNKFKLPNYVDKYLLASDSSVGKYESDGLPNIEGQINNATYGLQFNNNLEGSSLTSNKISTYNGISLEPEHSGNAYTINYEQLKLDAARHNPIYGSSNKVRPASIRVIPLIKY